MTTQPAVRSAIGLAAGLFLVYNSNLRAIPSRDTHVNEYVAVAFAATGSPDLSGFANLERAGLARGYLQKVRGRTLSNYPLLPPLLAAPVYWTALAAGVIDASEANPLRLEGVGKIVASATTAAACAVLALILRSAVPHAPAWAIAASAGLATPYWSTASQALWGHSFAALLLALSLLSITSHRLAAAFAAGVFAALAISCRPLLVVFAMGQLVAVSFDSQRRLSYAFFYATGVLSAIGAVAALNMSFYGDVTGGVSELESAAVHLATHNVASAFGTDILTGALGILVSPSRGLLVFCPVAVVALAACCGPARISSFLLWTVVVPTTIYLGLWAAYAVWWGGHTYGPRYATDIVVPLAIGAGFAFESLRPMRPKVRVLLVSLLIWSISVQAIGAYCYPNGRWNETPVDVDRARYRLWDWRDNQICRTARAGLYLRHLRFLFG